MLMIYLYFPLVICDVDQWEGFIPSFYNCTRCSFSSENKSVLTVCACLWPEIHWWDPVRYWNSPWHLSAWEGMLGTLGTDRLTWVIDACWDFVQCVYMHTCGFWPWTELCFWNSWAIDRKSCAEDTRKSRIQVWINSVDVNSHEEIWP